MPLWLPGGAAGIDNLAVPLVLAPLIWAGLFFHACLDRSLARVALVAGVLFLVHGGLPAPAGGGAGRGRRACSLRWQGGPGRAGSLWRPEIGRANGYTPVTNEPLVCCLWLENIILLSN